MSSESRKLRVLLAYTEEPDRQILRRMLEAAENIELTGVTSDGRDAIELCDRQKPALAVLDTDLPNIDGLSVVRHIRNSPNSCKTDILLLTSFYGRHLLDSCILYQVSYSLRKPILPQVLFEHITDWERARIACRHALDEQRLRQQIEQTVAPLVRKTSTKGYRYLIDAICLYLQLGPQNSGITKSIYPQLAMRHGTTPANVEQALRYTVQDIWQHSREKLPAAYFPPNRLDGASRLSSGRFLSSIAAYIRHAAPSDQFFP